VKISAKTLNAARKAAEARGMSLDKWAEQVLAEAAVAPDRSSNIDARLREISAKIDRLADRQSLGERASEQLAGAVQELGESYKRTRKSAGQIMSEAETRASSTAEDFAARARELIAAASKTATDLVGSLTSKVGDGRESAAEPTAAKSSQGAREAVERVERKAKSAASRRKTKSEKPRGSQRRRSQQKSGPSAR
jgi:hypothetical protein